MKTLAPATAALGAVAANPDRPATAILHDSPDARLVVFRLAPGQFVPPHRSTATVMLHVLQGTGELSGADDAVVSVSPGDLVTYEAGELHGMRAIDEQLLLLATITPRPGAR